MSFNSQLSPSVVKTALDDVFMPTLEKAPGPFVATALDPLVFNQSKADKASVIMEVYGGVTAWEATAEEEDLKTGSPRVDDQKVFSISKFTKSVDIPKTFFDDAQHDTIGKMMRDFAFKARVARDKEAMSLFRLGFTTKTTADGVAVFSNSHSTVHGDTVDNLGTSALTESSFNQALVMLGEQRDQSGELVGHPAKCLLVPMALFAEACRITKSELRPGTANNDINAHSSMYDIDVRQSPYLGAAAGGSDTAWFLLGENHGAYRWVREGINTNLVSYEYSRNDNYVYKGRFREVTGAVTYEGLVGFTGAA